MPIESNFPAVTTNAPSVPLWKSLLLIATFVVAAICIVKFDIIIGGILFSAAIFMQAYGGFSNARPIAGETSRRTAIFVGAWLILVLLAGAAQRVIPPFRDVLTSFGADLPLITRLTMDNYPVLLILPFAVAMVWQFWPQRSARLRAAAIACWSSIALIGLVLGSMYLPIFQMGPMAT